MKKPCEACQGTGTKRVDRYGTGKRISYLICRDCQMQCVNCGKWFPKSEAMGGELEGPTCSIECDIQASGERGEVMDDRPPGEYCPSCWPEIKRLREAKDAIWDRFTEAQTARHIAEGKLQRAGSQLTTTKVEVEQLLDSLEDYLNADTGHRKRELEAIAKSDEHPLCIIEMTIGYLKATLTKLGED